MYLRCSGDSRKFYMGWQKGGKLNSRVANHTHKVKSSQVFLLLETHMPGVYMYLFIPIANENS